jgi:hypothetical protein
VKDIDAKLAELEKVWRSSRGDDREQAATRALRLCRTSHPLPGWLFKALHENRMAEDPPDTHEQRSIMVISGRMMRIRWDDVFSWASEMLADTPASGGAEAIRKSHRLVEKRYRAVKQKRQG